MAVIGIRFNKEAKGQTKSGRVEQEKQAKNRMCEVGPDDSQLKAHCNTQRARSGDELNENVVEMEKGRRRGAQGYMLFLGLLLAASHQPAAAFVAISVAPQGGLPSVAAGVGRAGGLQVGGFIARRVAISRISGEARAGARCGIVMLAKKDSKKPGTVAENKQVRFNFEIDETYECGIALVGTEVKSCRAGKIQIKDGYVRVDRDGQLKLFNVNIAQHDHTGLVFNHEERRPRVLLAHKSEISQIFKKQEQKGGTCVPLRVYFNDIGFLKCEIATCRGKRKVDKKEDLKDKDIARDTKRALKDMDY